MSAVETAVENLPVLIVGQGIAGTMFAWELMTRGYRPGDDFLILDAGPEFGSSLSSTGLINPVVFKRMTLSWGADLVDIAWDRYGALEKRLAREGYARSFVDMRPIIRLFRSRAERDAWQAAGGALGLPPADDALSGHRIAPAGALAGAADIPGSGRIRPDVLLRGFRSWMEGCGGLVRGILQTSGERPPSAGELSAAGIPSTFVPRSAVLSTGIQFRYGAGGGRRPEYHLPDRKLLYYPVKGDVLELSLPELDGLSRGRILNAGISIIPAESPGHYLAGSSYIRDFEDPSPDPGGAGWILDQLHPLVPALERKELESRVLRRRAGIRPASRDRLAYLGPVDSSGMTEGKSFYRSFNGLGTRGYMLAPGLARILADHLLEGTAVPAELHPGRNLKPS
jgi:glycine/D-amino acid oxidase-like deaminating enzyme